MGPRRRGTLSRIIQATTPTPPHFRPKSLTDSYLFLQHSTTITVTTLQPPWNRQRRLLPGKSFRRGSASVPTTGTLQQAFAEHRAIPERRSRLGV